MKNKTNLCEFLKLLPKSDLHVHLDGSVRIETLIELSKKSKLSLPSYTVEGLNELVFKEHYANLVEYLAGFGHVLPIMQTAENIERISYEFAMDNISEGVTYLEVRFAPQLHTNGKLNLEQVLLSVDKGLKRAQKEYNNSKKVKSGELLEFNYGIIVGALRFFFKGMFNTVDQILLAFPYTNHNTIFAMAAMELVKNAVAVRDKYNIPIVAIDLLGAEAGNPPIYYKDAYLFAKQNLMHLIAHAGEAYGPESIFQAVTEIGAERIGHGTSLFSIREIKDKTIPNKKLYIERLIKYIAEKRINIEVCLTSNLQTLPEIGKLTNHPFAKMLAADLSVSICTDNRTVSKTSVTRELFLAVTNFKLSKNALKQLILNGFKRSFYFGSYLNKVDYIKKVAAKFDLLANKHYSK